MRVTYWPINAANAVTSGAEKLSVTKVSGARNAGRLSVMLSVASLMGTAHICRSRTGS